MPPSIEYESRYKKSSVVTAGSNFRVACSVLGCPRPAVTWSKNALRLTGDDKPLLDNPTDTQHYLTIKDCDRHDSGSYEIRAQNEHGSERAEFSVQVVDVPERPRGPMDVTLEAEQARYATLEWREPRWDGGSEIIGYTIEFAKNLEPVYSQSKTNRYLYYPYYFHALQLPVRTTMLV